MVLFGSRASGQASPDSDVDLLVVESDAFDAGRSRRRETARLLEALARFAVPIEVLVYSRAEVEQWRHSLNNVVGQAIRKGTVIYERPASGPLAA
ncbi:MAG: nucleotidyltransferase domain-containing protein [Candidatus Sumerlaeota bacterium]|nr:nucleotidyltransferase domain-containing protein [Candidatus Sumerlaeota bacterium]